MQILLMKEIILGFMTVVMPWFHKLSNECRLFSAYLGDTNDGGEQSVYLEVNSVGSSYAEGYLLGHRLTCVMLQLTGLNADIFWQCASC